MIMLSATLVCSAYDGVAQLFADESGELFNSLSFSARYQMLNNYYNCAGASATVNPRKNSEFLIEGNYFETGVTKVFSQSDAIAYQFIDNTYKSASQPSGKGTVTMPYKYTAISSKDVTALLNSTEGAGATLTDPLAIGTSGIATPSSSTISKRGIIYNLSGQKMDSNYRGIFIKDGHKYIKK